MSSPLLGSLERASHEFGAQRASPAATKLALLLKLERTRLSSARAVLRLHEVLCFLRAYPDDARVLAQVESMLARFAQRFDLRRFRHHLADSGIAGTTIHYRFFGPQAQWLALHWPALLTLDRSDSEADGLIARALPLLVTRPEAEALRELKLPGYAALDRLRGRRETDAAFLVRRIAHMPGDGFTREAFSDAIDASFRLSPGADSPSRTHAKLSRTRIIWQREPLRRARPDLRIEIARAPRSLHRLSPRRGSEIVDLARGAMVTHARALEALSYANPRDVWLFDDGAGLAFAMSGVVPERRHTIAAIYGGLTLKNGVPAGYLQADVVGRSAAISFNTFATFRDGESAMLFARMLAALRHAFGATSFSIEPYQLGEGNDEGLASGAWWFYYKLGFRPRDVETQQRVRAELERMLRNPNHRSDRATLRALARRHLFFELDPVQPRPLPPLAAIGLRVADLLAQLDCADRDRALDGLSAEAAQSCALATRSLNADERAAWRRWSPIIALLDVDRWTADERAALVAVVRAKAARSERDFVTRYAAHPRLDRALMSIGQRASRARRG